jgi:hypothetical protein
MHSPKIFVKIGLFQTLLHSPSPAQGKPMGIQTTYRNATLYFCTSQNNFIFIINIVKNVQL